MTELRVFRVDVSQITPDAVSLGDLIDICEAAEVAPDDLSPLMADPKAGTRRLKALAAFAWTIARRDDPELTYADVLAGRVDLIGGPGIAIPDPPVSGSDAGTPDNSGPGS
jgi:hypothetical protein